MINLGNDLVDLVKVARADAVKTSLLGWTEALSRLCEEIGQRLRACILLGLNQTFSGLTGLIRFKLLCETCI
jgi:hypothetical protein